MSQDVEYVIVGREPFSIAVHERRTDAVAAEDFPSIEAAADWIRAVEGYTPLQRGKVVRSVPTYREDLIEDDEDDDEVEEEDLDTSPALIPDTGFQF